MKYITVEPHGGWAGIGHQFCNWLVPYVLAKKYDLKFIHQQFIGDTDGTHASQGSNAYQIIRPVKEWNNFLNFGENELTINDLPKDLKIIDFPYINQEEATYNHKIYQTILSDKKFNNNNILYNVSKEKEGQFLCIDWNFYKNNDLKKKYNNSNQIKNFKNYFNLNNINIAIAIRRGDVTKDQQYRRWMDIDYYQNIILLLSKIEFIKQPIFHIYSWDMPINEQKRISAIRGLLVNDQQLQMHINEDVFSTFFHMTKADIFVSGQGAFSLLANYLTDAIKLNTSFYMFWNNFPEDIKDIIKVNNDGSFDKNKLMEAIK